MFRMVVEYGDGTTFTFVVRDAKTAYDAVFALETNGLMDDVVSIHFSQLKDEV